MPKTAEVNNLVHKSSKPLMKRGSVAVSNAKTRSNDAGSKNKSVRPESDEGLDPVDDVLDTIPYDTPEDPLEGILSPKEIIPGKWISLNSDLEIQESHLEATRERIRLQVERPRREFGGLYCFSTFTGTKNDPLSWNPIPRDVVDLSDLQKEEIETSIQYVTPSLEQGSQTNWKGMKNQFTQYEFRQLELLKSFGGGDSNQSTARGWSSQAGLLKLMMKKII